MNVLVSHNGHVFTVGPSEQANIESSLDELAGLIPTALPHLLWVYTPDLEKSLRQLRIALMICQGIE